MKKYTVALCGDYWIENPHNVCEQLISAMQAIAAEHEHVEFLVCRQQLIMPMC